MIREVKRDDIPGCVEIIRKSFQTVADEFGFTADNAPRFTAFAITEERLYWQLENEPRLMFVYPDGDKILTTEGFKASEQVFHYEGNE